MAKHFRVISCAACMSMLLGAPVRAQSDVTIEVGGGFARASSDLEGGNDTDLDGVFGIFGARMPNGVVFRASASITKRDESQTADVGFGPQVFKLTDQIRRLALSLGFIFRRAATFRPFVHGGVAYVYVDEDVNDFQVVDDSSTALSVGGGFEAGIRRHAFYFDVSLERGHEVDANFGLSGSKFDHQEIDVGYLYRF